MAEKSSKVLVALVILVVVLSVVFTWKALDQKYDFAGPTVQQSGQSVAATQNSAPLESGHVAINIVQPKEGA